MVEKAARLVAVAIAVVLGDGLEDRDNDAVERDRYMGTCWHGRGAMAARSCCGLTRGCVVLLV